MGSIKNCKNTKTREKIFKLSSKRGDRASTLVKQAKRILKVELRENVIVILGSKFKSVNEFIQHLLVTRKKTTVSEVSLHICDNISTAAQLQNQLNVAAEMYPKGNFFKAVVFAGGHGCEGNKLHMILDEDTHFKVDISSHVISAFKVTRHCHFRMSSHNVIAQ